MASALPLVVLLCLAVGQLDASAAVVNCVACEHASARLNCDEGQVILVHNANYGRHDRTTCSDKIPAAAIQNVKCSLPTRKVAESCDGKKSCVIRASNSVFGDPCVGTYKYLEVAYTCQFNRVACEHASARLNCDEGQVILVHSANYGRHDRTTCSDKIPAAAIQNVKCSLPTRKVAESCDGKNSCVIRASNSVFGDPCVGTYKYLEVAYTCQSCPPGWSLFGSRCFIVQTTKLTLAAAELNCIRLGGNLASIHDIKDHNFIRGMIKKVHGYNVRAWIGLADAIEEGKWLWTDGSRIVFTHWGRNEPNNSGNKEHCAHINFRGKFWNDEPCSRKFPSVCARGF